MKQCEQWSPGKSLWIAKSYAPMLRYMSHASTSELFFLGNSMQLTLCVCLGLALTHYFLSTEVIVASSMFFPLFCSVFLASLFWSGSRKRMENRWWRCIAIKTFWFWCSMLPSSSAWSWPLPPPSCRNDSRWAAKWCDWSDGGVLLGHSSKVIIW